MTAFPSTVWMLILVRLPDFQRLDKIGFIDVMATLFQLFLSIHRR